jgi:hypothetical protein
LHGPLHCVGSPIAHVRKVADILKIAPKHVGGCVG